LVTAGNALAVAVAATGTATITVGDGTNRYVTPTGCGDVTVPETFGMRYALSIAGGKTTITATLNKGEFGSIHVHEFSGAETFDNCAGPHEDDVPGTAANVITSTAAKVAANTYVFGATAMVCCNTATLAAGSTYTIRLTANDGGVFSASESLENFAGGSKAATFTDSSSLNPGSNYITGMISFKPSGQRRRQMHN
jgi:hypothetical protein